MTVLNWDVCLSEFVSRNTEKNTFSGLSIKNLKKCVRQTDTLHFEYEWQLVEILEC